MNKLPKIEKKKIEKKREKKEKVLHGRKNWKWNYINLHNIKDMYNAPVLLLFHKNKNQHSACLQLKLFGKKTLMCIFHL
jgi:hypothetical protein